MSRRASILLLIGVAAFGCVATYLTVALEARGARVRAVQADRWVSAAAGTTPASISFELRDGGMPTVRIVGPGDNATLRVLEPLGAVRVEPGTTAKFEWDGRDADGAPVADGTYRVAIDLGTSAIRLPTRIRVDSTPPVVECLGRDVRRPRRGVLRIHAGVDEPVSWRIGPPDKITHVVLRAGRLWDVRFQDCGPPIVLLRVADPFGPLTLTAVDRAGNRSRVEVPPDGELR